MRVAAPSPSVWYGGGSKPNEGATMAKHSSNSKSTQDLHFAHTAQVELPLPMLSALEDIDRAFFGVCIEAGKQVLAR